MTLKVTSAVGSFYISQDVFTNKSESVGGFLHLTRDVRHNLGELYSKLGEW